jgi:mono/diheme cytochrome c family protein
MLNRSLVPALVTPFLLFSLTACSGEEAPAPAVDRPAATSPAPAPTSAVSAPDVDLPAGVTAEMVAAGGAIYHGAGVCFSCHGQEGAGGPLGPSLTDRDWLNLASGTFEEIVAVIRDGVPRPVRYPAPMPPGGGGSLNDEQVRQVAAYVYALSHAE